MPPTAGELSAELSVIVAEFATNANHSLLRQRLESAIGHADAGAIVSAAETYRNEPDVVAPLYERVVALEPGNARAIVVLANAYWLQGRGPGVVGELASRAIAADPLNRGAWHLWALSEPDPRSRVRRWQQVAGRFNTDDLALAAVADNAASVAGAEQDYEMLDTAIDTYEQLLARTIQPAQREAVETALRAMRGWKF